MTRVVALASVLSEPITTPLVRKALKAGRRAEDRSPIPPAPASPTIQEAVSSVLGVPRAELLSTRRTPRVARARQLAMYLARELTSLSLAQIAREFDRDHSTVLHAIRTVSQRLEPGSETAEAIHKVRASLGTTRPADPGPGRRYPRARARSTGLIHSRIRHPQAPRPLVSTVTHTVNTSDPNRKMGSPAQ